MSTEFEELFTKTNGLYSLGFFAEIENGELRGVLIDIGEEGEPVHSRYLKAHEVVQLRRKG